MQDGFEKYLKEKEYKGKKYTAGGVSSRLSRRNRVESLIGMDLDAAIADDETMYKALLVLKAEEKEKGDHGNLQHVVRQYYEYKYGRKFPDLKVYEKLTGR